MLGRYNALLSVRQAVRQSIRCTASTPAPPRPVASSSTSSATTTTPSASSASAAAPSLAVGAGARPSKKHKKPKSKPVTQSPSLSVPLSSPSLLPIQRPDSTLKRTKEGSPAGYVVALTTAESYDTPALLESLGALGLLQSQAGPAVNLMGEAIYIPSWSPLRPDGSVSNAESGQVFIFESGTIVTWGLDINAAELFLKQVIRGASKTGKALDYVEQGRYAEPETEVLQYFVTDGPTKATGDAIFVTEESSAIPTPSTASAPALPSRNLLVRLAFSAGMARVTKLGVYEEQFDSFAEGVAGVAKQLESGSEAPVKKKDIIRSVGTLHGFRQKLNLEDENLLDEPEFLWEDAALHRHYTSICNVLDFDSRLATLNQRVDYAFQLQSTLMDLLNTSTSHRLEWIIILLIAFEICLVLYREGIPFLSAPPHATDDHRPPHKPSSRDE